jgi:type I restriction enzyme M protein
MESGYLLRDVINKVAGIHFTSSEETAHPQPLYENMLREMRDAAGDSGEFYTPRPVVRSWWMSPTRSLAKPCSIPPAAPAASSSRPIPPRQAGANRHRPQDPQEESLLGQEAKTAALHAVPDEPPPARPRIPAISNTATPAPSSSPRSATTTAWTSSSPTRPSAARRRRASWATSPDKQTAETALLFLQLIMRKLKRPHPPARPGRAAVVVPNGTLFGDGVCARIKEELLKEFNLHTIVRLPKGVFAPYTDIPTNLLFFDRSGPTRPSGTTKSRCPKAGRTTPRPCPCSSRTWPVQSMVHRQEARGEPAGVED